jgi:hypothetical protein
MGTDQELAIRPEEVENLEEKEKVAKRTEVKDKKDEE